MGKKVRDVMSLPKSNNMPTLGDLRKTIPAGGLTNPGLRKGFGQEFDVKKLHKRLLGQ